MKMHGATRCAVPAMRRACLFTLVWASGACGEDATTPPPGPRHRGIRIVAGAQVTDTAGSVLSQPLIVEVYDSVGVRASLGTVVRFEGIALPEGRGHEAFVQSLSSGSVDVVNSGTVDGAGRTGVYVQLGFVAGPARVAISVPTLGLRDTARFTVTPATANRLIASPLDTGVYVGTTLQLRGVVMDQFGNARNDPIAWTSLSNRISVTSTGLMTALREGRDSVTASAATRLTTSYVSVVPPGRIAAWTGSRIVAVDLDGGNFRDMAPANFGAIGAQPRWIPGTNTIVFAHWDGTVQSLYTVNDSGIVRRFFATTPADLLLQAEPQPTANGQWLYFSAQDARCAQYVYCLQRAHIDGTSPELLGNLIAAGRLTWRPAPSPDGNKVAFVTDDGGPVIKVFDVASRSVSPWQVAGQNPSWSPTGALIVFVPGVHSPLMLMNPDGTGVRPLTQREYDQQPLAWSRDARWILATRPTALDLIDVNTGEALPLSHLRGLSMPSFK